MIKLTKSESCTKFSVFTFYFIVCNNESTPIFFISMIILLGCANDNLEDMLISNIDCTTVDLQVTVNDFSTPNCTTEGSIMVAASGGIEPYSYSIDGETFSTNPVFSGLSGGDFVLIAMDSQGCIAEVDYTL